MMTGRNFRAMIGTIVVLADIFLVYKQIGSGEHFVLNDLIFHILAFGGGLLLIDFKVGQELLNKASKRFNGKFTKSDE